MLSRGRTDSSSSITVAFIKILWLDNKTDKLQVLKMCIFKLLDELFYLAIKDALLD